KNIKYGIRVQKLLKKNNISSTIFISNYIGHITEYVFNLSHKEDNRFYSIGGDGTLNEIVTGIIGTNSEIVVLSCGTGNDFAKTVNTYLSLRKVISNSINKESKKVDVIKVNNKYSINILSAGFDALVAKNVDIFRKVPLITGKIKYNLSIFYTLFFNKNFIFKIRVNDKIYKNHFTFVTISNGKFYGSGISPIPSAIVDDGILNVCIVDKTTHFDKIILLPKYKKSKHLDLNKVHIHKTEKISIVSNTPFPANIDGEIFYTKKLNCKIIKKAINIV
ncbi:MAG: diacylglycerol kinase family lipid kinase, partial [Clostridia bacterium]